MFGKKGTIRKSQIQIAAEEESERWGKRSKRGAQYRKMTKRPKNAPEDAYDRIVGDEARYWPPIPTDWLNDFPDFPFHVEGLKCAYIAQGKLNVSVYVNPVDSGLVQHLVDLANIRLEEASARWPIPYFAHALPAFYKKEKQVVEWPPNHAMLHISPYTWKGKIRSDAFRLDVHTPIWRKDGFFDTSVLECNLNEHARPTRIYSEYKVFKNGVGIDRITVESIYDTGGWLFRYVDVDIPRHRKTYLTRLDDPVG